MAVDKFKFVSPGVQIAEIDNSQVTATTVGVGPTIIGRFEKGPAMRPVRIGSFSQFVDIFGNPIAGKVGGDVWRNGNYTSPTYAAYAAQAWLRNTPSLNVIRLLGTENENRNATTGRAGWKTTAADPTTAATGGGAYGLFLIQSASNLNANLGTGSLAAVWYLQTGSIVLSGSDLTGTLTSGSSILLQGTGSQSNEFKAIIYNAAGAEEYNTVFNLNPDSDKYIRNVFNTNPVLTNTFITPTASQEKYWLGETFDLSLQNTLSVTTGLVGFVAPLMTASVNVADQRLPMQPAKTGWVFGQDLNANYAAFSATAQQKLFRLVAIDSGEWESKNLKISIYNIKPPANPDYNPYGTFSISIRRSNDTDANQKVVERYSNLDLNPASENFIARRIGDTYLDWSDSERRFRQVGTYPLVSKYVYVELDSAVELGLIDAAYLPFGFYGPPRYKTVSLLTGSLTSTNNVVTASAIRANTGGKFVNASGLASLTASFVYPTLPLVVSASSVGLSDPTKAYFGIKVTESGSTTLVDPSYVDMVRAKPAEVDSYDAFGETYVEDSFVFTLDDVKPEVTAGGGAVYVSGSRVAGTSWTAVSGWGDSTNGLLASGYNKFTMPFVGGFDGVDIVESDPFANRAIGSSETTSYEYHTIRRAIDTCADPETLVTDIIAIPGVTKEALTTHLINTCESRADALAVIDLPDVYVPEHESYQASAVSRLGSVDSVVTTLQGRAINSSYAATYFPWVQIRDTISNRNLFVPPSVVALGAMSYGQRTQELWFAPAGFTRGGLSEGRGGLPVISVSQRLNADERDTLYEANINPIASFPAEGIVIFGQKTLQVTPSALDRINVRRLVIFLKRQISIIASTILFDQNVSVTWNRFKSQASTFLDSVKSRLGITEYRLILDETTTTPDLVDRNIVYAKIFIKPARAIEYIAIDFVIAGSGASFND